MAIPLKSLHDNGLLKHSLGLGMGPIIIITQVEVRSQNRVNSLQLFQLWCKKSNFSPVVGSSRGLDPDPAG